MKGAMGSFRLRRALQGTTSHKHTNEPRLRQVRPARALQRLERFFPPAVKKEKAPENRWLGGYPPEATRQDIRSGKKGTDRAWAMENG